jgi:hypothetical protein
MKLQWLTIAAAAMGTLVSSAACNNTNHRPQDDQAQRDHDQELERQARIHAALGVPAPLPTSSGFDITGFLYEANVNGTGATDSGTLKVNGQLITVPANTIVILPGNQLTWTELFAQAPAPWGPNLSGIALADTPAPIAPYEVHVVGNRVPGAVGGDQFIAGLIWVFQSSAGIGGGHINYIDYTKAEMRVGGTLNDPNTGTRVRINDPVIASTSSGRYSKGQSPDPRFSADPDSPSIIAGSGFPMCLPRVAPPAPNAPETDPLCPQGNRPLDANGQYLISINMTDPATLAPGQLPDARIQAPFEVGDYITYAGILADDSADPLAGPWPGTANTYISAYQITNNTAIYTAPGADPAYIMIDVSIAATGGADVVGLAEGAVRTRYEGMTTDTSRNIHLYGIDVDPATGATSDRDWGTIGVDPGPPNGGTTGRWRFRPPCTPFGTPPANPQTDCVMNQSGTFLPPPREVRAVIEGQQGQQPGSDGVKTASNGIVFGQFHAPISQYVFPENIPGTPIIPNNFESMPFLACGGYKSSTGTLAGPLRPWPGDSAPTCAGQPVAPTAGAGENQVVASGAGVALEGSATGTAPLTFAWTQTAGPTVSLSDPTSPTPTFTAPTVTAPTVLTFVLTVSNSAGSATASVNITVSPPAAPVVGALPAQHVNSGTPVTFTATCSDPNNLPCTFVWTQTGGTPVVLSPNPKPGATIQFTVQLAVGAQPAILTFQVVATNSAGDSSLPTTTSVTINPPVDVVQVTSAQYRTGKSRLILAGSSNLISQSTVLTLLPYVTVTGQTFDPTGIGATFTNDGNGTYELQIDGVPEPALPPAKPLFARSSAGGTSAGHGLDQIRN